jgi:hypothetical protein
MTTDIIDRIDAMSATLDSCLHRSAPTSTTCGAPLSQDSPVHRADITPAGRPTSRGYTYRVTDRDTGQEWIAATREPLLALARLLHGLGADDREVIEIYRPGTASFAMRSTIGFARTRSVLETATSGPRFAVWRPMPDSWRPAEAAE